jgi:serine/threonine protein kinase
VAGPDLSGEVIDRRYQIVERIAAGAMGVVYRGTRLNLDRAVAIKVMHSALPGAMEAHKRFEREAQLMARLEHPHCVSIIDFGLHAEKPYVVMELVRGRSLHDVIVEQGRFEVPRGVDVLRQVLSGLAHAHEQGIIHRDIKPANIMITPKAPLGVHARILDFGLARMLGTSASLSAGVAVGTPSYMAPEQCRGDELDARVDIYACGVVLFEMLTGSKPFVASDPIAIIKKQIEQPPPRLADVAPGDYGALEAVVARALAKSPADRYPSAVAMAEALEAALERRRAPEATAAFVPQVGSSALVPVESSINIPITVGSSVRTPAPSRSEPSDHHDSSILRKSIPVSRLRYVVLAGLVVTAGAIVGIVVLRRELVASEADRAARVVVDAGVVAPVEPPSAIVPTTDPVTEIAESAAQLGAAGKLDAAIATITKARRQYPDAAVLPLTAGKLYLAKLWWNDGIANLREAIRLDGKLRDDPELIKLAIRGFLTTPEYDDRLGRFLVELGPATVPLLEETAQSHPNPDRRARATALLRKLRN